MNEKETRGRGKGRRLAEWMYVWKAGWKDHVSPISQSRVGHNIHIEKDLNAKVTLLLANNSHDTEDLLSTKKVIEDILHGNS